MAQNRKKRTGPSKPPKAVMKEALRPYRIPAALLRKMVREVTASRLPKPLNMIEAGFRLSASILLDFFGPEWFDYYLTYKGLMLESTYFGGEDRFFLRVTTLGEMLLNLQDVSGFRGCLRLLADGKIEAAFAELEVARFLSMCGVKFSFNERLGRPKTDYDLNVVFKNGENGCAETKCKSEDTPLSENTIFNSLHDARKQLPNDRPAAIFIKVPEIWLGEQEFRKHINAAVKRFLQETRTVVAIELFVTDFISYGTVAEQMVRGTEIINQHHDFDPTRDWSLIGPLPTQRLPAPPWWRHIHALIDPRVDPRSFSP
jgi:hypothetical protein